MISCSVCLRDSEKPVLRSFSWVSDVRSGGGSPSNASLAGACGENQFGLGAQRKAEVEEWSDSFWKFLDVRLIPTACHKQGKPEEKNPNEVLSHFESGGSTFLLNAGSCGHFVRIVMLFRLHSSQTRSGRLNSSAAGSFPSRFHAAPIPCPWGFHEILADNPLKLCRFCQQQLGFT